MQDTELAKVVEVHQDGRAVVEHDGMREEVLELSFVDEDIEVGDWVLVKAGFAIERLTDRDARRLLHEHLVGQAKE
ncbi:HypC/HybG/HupF family hydrogenase formation chaperone [Demequina lignilytica]|uniref:HypC/HybG/HupF family hydrogenase formation chaperone n=1 Tax=Demequina lignilytica TaxID=3051663 RepID=A0AB35MHR2_9MICO|nr:HypC/HybG/HupF family hydrogenase formation chaperone [Demequina sp. SYSU T0a273]MDN4483220.1 HypC/HybG/HupF family hydrogenase formation chaperone [Demequina sp. SYSU T0a273]